MEASPSTAPAKRKNRNTGYLAFTTIRAIMVGRHAAVDAGATRYVWFRPCPDQQLRSRVSAEAPTESGFSHWRCEPNGDVTFVKGTDDVSPRAWDVPVPPLSRTLAEKLNARGITATPTDNPEWISVFSAFSVLDACRTKGWSDEGKKRVSDARATAKMLVTRVAV